MNLFLSISGKVDSDILSQMRYNDIIIVFNNNKLEWGIIDDCVQKCRLRIFEIADIVSTPNFNDGFIFSYDAINYRSGNKEALFYLQQVFSNSTIQSFLDNLLDILHYKEDRIDSNIYTKFFSGVKCYNELATYHVENKIPNLKEEFPASNIIQGNLPKENKNDNIRHTPESYLFYDYLDTKCQELWHQYYNVEKYKTRDIFNAIRKSYPHLFTSALKAYNTKNKDGNIYNLKIFS